MGLHPGTELEVILDDFSIRLVRAVPGPELVRKGERLVARPTVNVDPAQVDVPKLIEEERVR